MIFNLMVTRVNTVTWRAENLMLGLGRGGPRAPGLLGHSWVLENDIGKVVPRNNLLANHYFSLPRSVHIYPEALACGQDDQDGISVLLSALPLLPFSDETKERGVRNAADV